MAANHPTTDAESSNVFADVKIFQQLQERIDEDVKIQEDLREIVRQLEKQNKNTRFVLAKAHSIKTSEYATKILPQAWESITQEKELIQALATAASAHPFYRWNNIWTRAVQDLIFVIVYWSWLGGSVLGTAESDAVAIGNFVSIEQVGQILEVPVNAQEDIFHLTIEEYLHSLITLIDELSRLARNVVIVKEYALPLKISTFVKDLQAGFMVLNLKNDLLRKRFDSIKYKVKEVEDVVYDLSLRNLLPSSD